MIPPSAPASWSRGSSTNSISTARWSIEEDDDRILLTVEGEDDYGLLIGKRGQTIDALQLLCYQAAFRGLRERKRVVVDAAGYRGRRRETLEGRADRAAEQALTNNRVVEMDPMSAQERRVVHERLKERARGRDLQRGRRAPPLRDRRAARSPSERGPGRGARPRPARAQLRDRPRAARRGARLGQLGGRRARLAGPRRRQPDRARGARAARSADGSPTSGPGPASPASSSPSPCPRPRST